MNNQNKGAPGVIGPGLQSTDVSFDLPACVQLKTKKDEAEFQAFITAIVKAANQNAVRVLQDFDPPQDVLEQFALRIGV